MDINRIKTSRYLTKEDCGQGIIVTLDQVQEGVNIGTEEQPEEGFVLHFMEQHIKPMVLKPTNAQLIAEILQATDTLQWRGRQIMLYADMSVMFAGKRVGGIRPRALPPQPPQYQQPYQQPPQGYAPAPGYQQPPPGGYPPPSPTQPYRTAPPAGRPPVNPPPAYQQPPAAYDRSMDGDPGDLPPADYVPPVPAPGHPGGRL